jgi:hypothetical protein
MIRIYPCKKAVQIEITDAMYSGTSFIGIFLSGILAKTGHFLLPFQPYLHTNHDG